MSFPTLCFFQNKQLVLEAVLVKETGKATYAGRDIWAGQMSWKEGKVPIRSCMERTLYWTIVVSESQIMALFLHIQLYQQFRKLCITSPFSIRCSALASKILQAIWQTICTSPTQKYHRLLPFLCRALLWSELLCVLIRILTSANLAYWLHYFILAGAESGALWHGCQFSRSLRLKHGPSFYMRARAASACASETSRKTQARR